MAWKRLIGLAVCAAFVGLTAGSAAAQDAVAEDDNPITRFVILAISERPAETPDDYVHYMDETLAELAAWGDLPVPETVRAALQGAVAATVPPVLPARREDFVVLSFHVAVGRFARAGVPDGGGLAPEALAGSFTDEASCRSVHPDRTFVAFRTIQVGARLAYQCIRQGRFGDSRQLYHTAYIDMEDRRIVSGGHFASMGTVGEVARVFAASEQAALRLFDSQTGAVFDRLIRPSER